MESVEGVEHCPNFHEELTTRFTYHSPTEAQRQRYFTIRLAAHDLAMLFNSSCPESRELSLALTKLQEAVMWANASIACREK